MSLQLLKREFADQDNLDKVSQTINNVVLLHHSLSTVETHFCFQTKRCYFLVWELTGMDTPSSPQWWQSTYQQAIVDIAHTVGNTQLSATSASDMQFNLQFDTNTLVLLGTCAVPQQHTRSISLSVGRPKYACCTGGESQCDCHATRALQPRLHRRQ